MAWTVGSDKGFMNKLLGSPGDSVLRGGFTVAYQRPGMSDFTQVFGANPGVSIDATRNQTNGNLGTLMKELMAGDRSGPTSLKRPSRQLGEVLVNPREPPFALDSAVQSIELVYPQRDSFTTGTDRWVLYWLAISLIAAWAAKPLLKVHV